MTATAYRTLRKFLSWHYLAQAGEPLWLGVGETVDTAAERLRLALRCRFPSLAPVDALPLISAAQNLDYPSAMAPEFARLRLADPWGLWELAGGRARLLSELGVFGLANCEVVSWRDLRNQGVVNPFGGDSSCWYLIVRQPHPWRPPVLWDGGALWDQAGITWDLSGHDPVFWGQILRVLAKWGPAAASCRFVEIWLKVDLFGNPTEVARIPVWEDWELDAAGNGRDYYNTGYL